jgi:hypothetical protein
MALTTAATQKYLQPFEGATGWGVFLPGDAPPQLATPKKNCQSVRAGTSVLAGEAIEA